jgi:predicted  nucleic acid-binding Zn-ribbon protein
MTQGADLYRLQCLDHEGDLNERRLAQVEAALGESEELKQARRTVTRAQTSIQEWSRRQRDLDLETQGLANKIAGSEQRLYSGAVKNPKELSDLQAELASLRRRRQHLEDDLLSAMIELEEAENAHGQASDHLDQIQARWTAEQADLVAEKETLQGKQAEIAEAQAELLPKIDAGDLDTYQRLRRTKGGLAVVQVQNGACGGCGLGISPALDWKIRHESMGICSNCRRIIVAA